MGAPARSVGYVAALASLLSACTRDHTAIVVHVASDLGSELESVDVAVQREGSAEPTFEQTFDVRDGGVALPGTVAITPRDPSDARPVQIHVTGTLASHATVERDVTASFVRGQEIEVDVLLSAECDADAGCAPGDAGDAGDAGTCNADAGTVDFAADFDDGGYAQFDRLASPRAACFTAGATPARTGVAAAGVTVAPGDAVGAREQCLLYWDASNEQDGTDAYYAWSVFVPADWVAPPDVVRFAGWSGTIAPPIAFGIDATNTFQVETHTGFVDTAARTFERDDVETLSPTAFAGLWHDFVVHVVFHADTDAGLLEVWYRHPPQSAFLQVGRFPTYTLQRDSSRTLPTSFFVGLDRAPAGVTQGLVIDRVRRGSSFDAVAQDGCGP